MKLQGKVRISQEKLLKYLLLHRDEDDKSKFLSLAGYNLSNWHILEGDLKKLISEHEISDTETSPFGTKYEVRGTLVGPNNRTLRVVTIWIKLQETEEIRYVTLFPG